MLLSLPDSEIRLWDCQERGKPIEILMISAYVCNAILSFVGSD